MAQLKDIVTYINEYLQVDRFQDYCPNGLQVEGQGEIQHIISGVSASFELFDKANNENGDLILVHHGLFWGGKQSIIAGSYKKRLQYLLKNELTLLAYHLPLDAHEELGNNVAIANKLDLIDLTRFAKYKGNSIGWMGNLKEKMTLSNLIEKIKSIFKGEVLFYPYGNETVEKVGIVSGGASDNIMDAIKEGCDVYLTGEVAEPTMHLAKEEMINFVAVGHYNSEKFGIQALGEKVAKEFNIKHTFIDIPNSV